MSSVTKTLASNLSSPNLNSVVFLDISLLVCKEAISSGLYDSKVCFNFVTFKGSYIVLNIFASNDSISFKLYDFEIKTKAGSSFELSSKSLESIKSKSSIIISYFLAVVSSFNLSILSNTVYLTPKYSRYSFRYSVCFLNL